MKRPLRVITIEGFEGIGATSQSVCLRKQLKTLGYTSKIVGNLSIEDTLKTYRDISGLLKDSQIVIFDGSIAKPIADDIAGGRSHDQLYNKYKEIVFEMNQINHIYGMVNLVLVPTDVRTGLSRLERRSALLGVNISIEETDKHRETLFAFNYLNSHICFKDVEFDVVKVEENDRMLLLNSKLWDVLDKRDIKSPPERASKNVGLYF